MDASGEVRARDEAAEDRPCRSALVYSWVVRVGSGQSRARVSLTRKVFHPLCILVQTSPPSRHILLPTTWVPIKYLLSLASKCKATLLTNEDSTEVVTSSVDHYSFDLLQPGF